MAVERAPGGSSLIDVLDRVLDKGIVIDAYVRVSLVGIDLVTVEARVVVASIDTYLKYSEAVGITGPARSRELSAPSPSQIEMDRMAAENAELKKKLARLRIVSGEAAPGAEIRSGDRPAGRLGSVVGDQALAVLRVDRFESGQLTADSAIFEPIDAPE